MINGFNSHVNVHTYFPYKIFALYQTKIIFQHKSIRLRYSIIFFYKELYKGNNKQCFFSFATNKVLKNDSQRQIICIQILFKF